MQNLNKEVIPSDEKGCDAPDVQQRGSNAWIFVDAIPPDLLAIKKRVYDPHNFYCSELKQEDESAEYSAFVFKLNGFTVRFRVAKITPTKVGQFVTLWKRIGNARIQPYDACDPVDFFIVSTRTDHHFGHFVFPMSALREQGVVSINGNGGKLAMRVYSPWDKTTSRQAQKTQCWQLQYFLETNPDHPIDNVRAQMLYNQKPNVLVGDSQNTGLSH